MSHVSGEIDDEEMFVFTSYCVSTTDDVLYSLVAVRKRHQLSLKVPSVQESDENQEEREAAEQKSEEADEELHTAEEEGEHEVQKPEEVMPTIEIPSSSVLHLIPQQTFGIIYCPSLAELDDRVNMLAMDLMPTAENPEIIAKILADRFGAGFESLAELQEIGLDMNQDFAMFMTSSNPSDMSATVHLTDSAAMKQVIAAESEGSAATEYNGVSYWNAAGGGGSFAIIDDILVFTRSPESVKVSLTLTTERSGLL